MSTTKKKEETVSISWRIDDADFTRQMTKKEVFAQVERIGQPLELVVAGNNFNDEFLAYFKEVGSYLLTHLTAEELQSILGVNIDTFNNWLQNNGRPLERLHPSDSSSAEELVQHNAVWMTYVFIWDYQYNHRRKQNLLFGTGLQAPEKLQSTLEVHFPGQTCTFDVFVEVAWYQVASDFLGYPFDHLDITEKHPELEEISDAFYKDLKAKVKAHIETLYK